MSTRVMAVAVDIDDEVSQGDEFETLMSMVDDLIKSYIDPAIGRVRVFEPDLI